MLYLNVGFAVAVFLGSLWFAAFVAVRAESARTLGGLRNWRDRGPAYPPAGRGRVSGVYRGLYGGSGIAGEFEFERAIEAYEELIDLTHSSTHSKGRR